MIHARDTRHTSVLEIALSNFGTAFLTWMCRVNGIFRYNRFVDMLKASNLVNAVVICKSNHPLVGINNVNYSMFFEIVGGLGRLRYRFVLSDVLLRKAQV